MTLVAKSTERRKSESTGGEKEFFWITRQSSTLGIDHGWNLMQKFWDWVNEGRGPSKGEKDKAWSSVKLSEGRRLCHRINTKRKLMGINKLMREQGRRANH